MSAIQKDYGPRGFQALGTAFNELAPQLVPGFITKFRPNFPVGYTSRETVYEYLQAPSNTPFNVPIYVFIDKTGMIRQQEMGATVFFQNEDKNTRAVIESLLKETGPARKKRQLVGQGHALP